MERMFIPSVSTQSASLFEHCQRALSRMLQLGPHSLPLMGTGDWNDGMNHVGPEGHGESVWLGWFFCTTASLFGRILERRDPKAAAALRDRAKALAATIERTCWDGEWYLRAFFDDGTALASPLNADAKIDSLAQSWAVLSGLADSAHSLQAMHSCERLLVKESERRAPVHARVRSFHAAPRVHHGLSSWRSRKRRPVYTRIAVARGGLGATRQWRGRCQAAEIDESDRIQPDSRDDRAFQRRAVCVSSRRFVLART